MHAMSVGAIEAGAPVTASEIEYASKPWLLCDHCGKNTWRKAARDVGRGRRMPNYCNLECQQAALRERQRSRHRSRRSSAHISLC
jgi:hypothetical protein